MKLKDCGNGALNHIRMGHVNIHRIPVHDSTILPFHVADVHFTLPSVTPFWINLFYQTTKFLDQIKLKANADDKSKVTQMITSVFNPLPDDKF